MNTIDEILASGRYTDGVGREWVRRLFLRPNIRWANIIRDRDGIGWPGEKISEDQMRLLIERDQHRDVCRGVRDCQDHPVPRVFQFVGPFGRWSALDSGRSALHDSAHPTFPEAMDAARALAVGSCS